MPTGRRESAAPCAYRSFGQSFKSFCDIWSPTSCRNADSRRSTAVSDGVGASGKQLRDHLKVLSGLTVDVVLTGTGLGRSPHDRSRECASGTSGESSWSGDPNNGHGGCPPPHGSVGNDAPRAGHRRHGARRGTQRPTVMTNNETPKDREPDRKRQPDDRAGDSDGHQQRQDRRTGEMDVLAGRRSVVFRDRPSGTQVDRGGHET